MDLLRQILVRLPITGLQKIIHVDRALILLRLRVVNHLDETILDGTGSLFGRYFVICGFQGEFLSVDDAPIDYHFMLERAVFMEDEKRFSKMLSRGALGSALDLYSPSPLIRQKTVERITPSHVTAPEDIVWTGKMKETMQKRIDRYDCSEFLRGYMAYGSNSGDYKIGMEKYLSGYITAAMREADPFQINDAVENLHKVHEQPGQRTVNLVGGYYKYATVEDIPFTVMLVQSGLLEHFLSAGVSVGKIDVTVSPYGLRITRKVVANAECLLKLEKNGELFSDHYRMVLRILTGRSVQLGAFTDIALQDLIVFMWRVAHPQLTRDLMIHVTPIVKNNASRNSSWVFYDLVNFFNIGAEVEEGLATYQDRLLFARGQTMRIAGSNRFKWFLSKVRK